MRILSKLGEVLRALAIAMRGELDFQLEGDWLVFLISIVTFYFTLWTGIYICRQYLRLGLS